MPRASRLACLVALIGVVQPARASETAFQGFRPADDQQIVERLRRQPLGASRPRQAAASSPALRATQQPAEQASQRHWRELRQRARQHPDDQDLAVTVARHAMDQARLEGDPRWLGQAQAALAHWWGDPSPPPLIRFMRATVRQSQHAFDAAEVDLRALMAEPTATGASAALEYASLLQVRGRYLEAAQVCQSLLSPGDGTAAQQLDRQPDPAVIVSAQVCLAELSTLTAPAQAGRDLLARLDASPLSAAAGPGWISLIRAQVAERNGQTQEALRLYAQALQARPDVYTVTAYADALLDQSRNAEAMALLQDRPEADAIVLRRALACQRLGCPQAGALQANLRARMEAAALRGDLAHQREVAWWSLYLLKQAEPALKAAQANWALQREPIDARLYLAAAQAAGQPQAAEPVRVFIKQTGLRDQRLAAWLK